MQDNKALRRVVESGVFAWPWSEQRGLLIIRGAAGGGGGGGGGGGAVRKLTKSAAGSS